MQTVPKVSLLLRVAFSWGSLRRVLCGSKSLTLPVKSACGAARSNLKLVKAGTDLQGEILISNTTASPAVLHGTVASCGCTSITLDDGQPIDYPLIIPAGQLQRLNVAIDTEHAEGQRRVTVTCDVRDPNSQISVVPFYFTVLSKPRVHPNQLTLPSRKAPQELSFRVGALEKDDVQISSVDASLATIQITTKAIKRFIEVNDGPYLGWVPKYEVKLNWPVDEDTSYAPFYVNVHLVGQNRPLTVRILKGSDNGFQCVPSRLIFKPGAQASRLVELRGCTVGSFVHWDNPPGIKFRKVRDAGKTRYFKVTKVSDINFGRGVRTCELTEISDDDTVIKRDNASA